MAELPRRWMAAAAAAAVLLTACARRSQTIDTSFEPDVRTPTFSAGEGPLVLIDEAHHNFHTLSGRYRHFAEILRRDGYRVEASTMPFSKSSLGRSDVDIVVIANALNERNAGNGSDASWSLPTPSAFSGAEIDALAQWVSSGGSLLLIADHMPFPGAAAELAARLGFRFGNGFAFDESQEVALGDLTEAVREPCVFTLGSGLARHSVTEGLGQIATFTGQAFAITSEEATSLLTFGPSMAMLMTETAWELEEAERVPVEGWSQGAVRPLERGRVAVFGEAAMFTAQLASGTGRLMGLNAPEAVDNQQFLLNVMHWLSERP